MESITHPLEVLGSKQPQRFVQLVAGTAALAGLLFGFDTGVISGAILFIKGAFGLSPFAEEVLVSAALVGAVCGGTLSGRFTDVLGRKRAILITAAIFTVGSILCAVAGSLPVSVWTFILYAALCGVGVWFCLRLVPETKGVPLESIERDLRARRPLRELGAD